MNVQNASNLDMYLHQILSSVITLDEDLCRESNKNLQNVLHNRLLDEMRNCNPVFKKLFKQLHYGGSYYENLRVTDPNEFDINMELCLPVRSDLIQVMVSEVPGFAKVRVQNLKSSFISSTDADIRSCVERWFDDEGYLQRTKLFSWMQGVLDVALSKTSFPFGYRVVRITSGPAITLVVQVNAKTFTVDLVPVFGFEDNKWPARPFRQPHEIPRGTHLTLKWFVVPKSPGGFSDNCHLWRLSFYNQEKVIMNDLANMKPVLKLIKRVRDVYNWKGLSSYYLKTIFMWEQTHQPERFWNQGLGFLFLHMLERVEAALRAQNIPFYWDDRFNLLQKIPQTFIVNTANCISRMRKKIIANLNTSPEYILIVFQGSRSMTLPESDSSSDSSSEAYSPESWTVGPSSSQTQTSSTTVAATVGILGAVAAVAAGIGFLAFRNRNNNQNN